LLAAPIAEFPEFPNPIYSMAEEKLAEDRDFILMNQSL
jgi:hypothetical protein